MDHIIAVDIGGTNIRAALFPRDSDTHSAINKIPTVSPQDPAISAVDRVIECISSIWPKDGNVLGICAAAPGSIAVKEGLVLLAPNIEGWENIPLGQILSEKFGVKTLINNDARLAAYGEWKKGAGIGYENLLYFTVSTGLGGGIIANGDVIQGDIGIATEVGHIVLHDKGNRCGCGLDGHWEAFSSGTGIENYVRNRLVGMSAADSPFDSETPTTPQIAAAASDGFPIAIEAFERAGYYLGIGVSNYLHIFNPSCVIFGGGVSQVGELIFTPFQESLKKHVLNLRYIENLAIKMAELGDNAGLVGSAEYIRDRLD